MNMDKFGIPKKSFAILTILLVGIALGVVADKKDIFDRSVTADGYQLDEQAATVQAIKNVDPAVVSIIIYDYEDGVIINSSTGEKKVLKERKEEGQGTGFLISSDGMIITNKHVISAGKKETAEYRIIMNSGKEYYAQYIGVDPLKDLGVLKIFDKNLPFINMGDSDQLQVGQSVMAIGNALGVYHNSATKGIISGLGRSIVASDQKGNDETLDNVIQTDAEINLGNSGGPLIDLNGKVIGVNTAVDKGGSSIGFAIPINDVRPIINSIKESGRVIRPYVGIRYLMLNEKIAYDNNLSRASGAWVVMGKDGSPAVAPDSPAAKAGIGEGDIIFEINAIKLDEKNTLGAIVQKYKPGDKIGMKILRRDKTIIRIVEVGEIN